MAADYQTKEDVHVTRRQEINKRREQGMIIVGTDINTNVKETGGNADGEGVGPYISRFGHAIEEGAGVAGKIYVLRAD